MLANPYIEAPVLTGPTPLAAKANYAMTIAKEQRQGIYRHVIHGQPYTLLAIRIAPPLKCTLTCGVSDRFRALVTWMPMR